MSSGDPRGAFLYSLPSTVLWDFCRLMDGLSDRDWTRFASEVLDDQTAVRLAQRSERRTDDVINQWGNRNGRVGELIDLLERLQLLRPRDVIIGWSSSLSSSSPPPPAAPPAAPPPHVSPSRFDPPAKRSQAPPTARPSEQTTTAGLPLPRPAPPPSSLQSRVQQPPQPCPVMAAMCWSYEEVHAGTEGFSPSLQVGEGGFGVVYRAKLKNTDCAVKRLRQDCDWTLMKESFQTEVDKLTKFRHPNIVDLLGFSEGQGSVCLIYSFMHNRSLEDQLHNECVPLSWSQRLSIVKGASTALQFLHCPPNEHTPLIHGDVKSSNILLDRHLEAKLADFGLARFASRGSSGRRAAQTVSVGKTETVRGTLAYLPVEYVMNGELGTATDVYSFGVVMLEVLTGRRALEKNKSGDRYLKDLVEEVEDSPSGSSAAAWRTHLDQHLLSGGAAEPQGWMEVVALACRCLDRRRKKRPPMTQVFDKLQDIVRKTSTSSSSLLYEPSSKSLPLPPHSLDSSVGALSHQMSKLGPLEDTYQPSLSSFSSSFCSLTPPHQLHSSSSLPSPSSSLGGLSSSSSLGGPCETDESRGFSQFRSHSAAGPAESESSPPSVPTEDQYTPPPQPSDRSGAGALTGAPTGPDPGGQTRAGATAGIYGVPESLSPVGSLRSLSPGPSVQMNPSKQRFLRKKTDYEEGRIQTAELLSSDDLYAGRSSEETRGPEESDELDYLPVKHH